MVGDNSIPGTPFTFSVSLSDRENKYAKIPGKLPMPLAKNDGNCYNKKISYRKGCARDEKLKTRAVVGSSYSGGAAGTDDGCFVDSAGIWFLMPTDVCLCYRYRIILFHALR